MLRIKGDSYDTMIRILVNVFKDPSLKEIYNKRAISEEYYSRAIHQRRLNKIGYFDKIKDITDVKDTGTIVYDKERYIALKNRSPFLKFNKKPPERQRKYINKIKLTFSDYELETIAHLQSLTGLSKPQDVILTCLKFSYMIFSQDRLIRNTNAELAENNLNLMIANSTIDAEPIIPFYAHSIPKIGREIVEELKLYYNSNSVQDLMRALVKEACKTKGIEYMQD